MIAASFGWWCSGAIGRPWTWEPRPLVGVWLLCGALLAGYALMVRGHGAGLTDAQQSLRRRRIAQFAGGVAVLWLASDWPLGPLGAGYLASVAALRYLLFVLVVAPLLVLGLPARAFRAVLAVPVVGAVLRFAARAPVALVLLNVTLVVSQLPPVVDSLKVNQFGSFALDMAWLVSAVIFWLPVLSPVAQIPRLSPPVRLVYLFAQSIVPTVPASFLTFSRTPLYSIYELTPRVTALSVLDDQLLAGVVMKIIGGFVLWGIMAAIFFRWAAAENEDGSGRGRGGTLRELERDLEAHDLRV